jgi:8-oxo-dGTP pyrophosphatase MutT (NUDIX family)
MAVRNKKVPSMYKTVASRTLLVHPRLTVVEDQIEMPNGETGDYLWFPEKREGVGLLVRRPDGRILVQRESSYVPGIRLYQLPGGGLGRGEAPEAAANRELAEEAGLFASKLTPLGNYLIDHRRNAGRMYLFLAEEIEPRVTTARDKYEVDLTTEWMTHAEIDELIFDGNISNVHLLAGWALYNSYRGRKAQSERGPMHADAGNTGWETFG